MFRNRLNTIDPTESNICFLQGIFHLMAATRRKTLSNQGIKRITMLDAVSVFFKPRVLGKRCITEYLFTQACKLPIILH